MGGTILLLPLYAFMAWRGKLYLLRYPLRDFYNFFNEYYGIQEHNMADARNFEMVTRVASSSTLDHEWQQILGKYVALY
jgi:hypothetical protein